ncbi:prepilin peptidase [Neobacillus novalis]|uniref:Prepilin peptidase n=1 Tax=Neobacillus novalis TaxID=220687 RepID=A0AA95MQS3_9BACI|nr:prepilin peptidase [Neobacillus novalis]WHY87707.1 prepilin peptidase [Neobacillus novalis]
MWSNYLLILLLIICVITDLKERKIYNAVLFPFLLAAWILHAVTGGLHGMTGALLGTAVGLGVLLIPYLLGGMGAGDVKLLAVIGGIKGIGFVLMASIYMALAGGIIAIFVLLFRKGFMTRILYFFQGLRHGVRLSLFEDKTTFPYGVAIAAGAVLQIFFPGVLSV